MSKKISSYFNLYGKSEIKHNRKMRRVTLFSDRLDEIEEF